MENNLEEVYDKYAAAALQGLISKAPLLDRDGEHSAPISQEDLDKFKKEMCESAHGYAYFMMLKRHEYLVHLGIKQ